MTEIERATFLAERHPTAVEILGFYIKLRTAQREHGGSFRDFLRFFTRQGTPAMVASARALLTAPDEQLERLLETDDFFARAYLQPRAEASPEPCSWCATRPVASVLRESAQGARRSLVCGLCSKERDFARILCPACGEQDFESLPVFSPEEFPHIRVEACDTCQSYLLGIDMTKDGLAVPVVDELAAISLNLWAQDQGYRKIQPNLFGL